MAKLVAGIDEAGRGPVIGPMVFSVVVMKSKDLKKLDDLKITDSKLIPAKERPALFEEIRKVAYEHAILSLSAYEITEWMKTASLNEVEAIKTAELLSSLECTPDVCYVDCPDVLPLRYSENIKGLCKKDTLIVAEHKADLTYKVAGAASILAKVTRDLEISDLCLANGNLGSGYAHDPITRKWLDDHWDEHRSFPDFVRKRWATVTRKAQLNLSEWQV